jgi:hypothetical protein
MNDFSYVTPTAAQANAMALARAAFSELWRKLEILVPEGPDKSHVRRLLRSAAMFSNAAISHENPPD